MICLMQFISVVLSGPTSPQNLSAKSINSTTILVSWKEPTSPNGKIKYRLLFKRTAEPSSVAQLVYDGHDTQHVVSNLKPYTRYTFSVIAYNVKYNLSSSVIVAVETTGQAG